jgi:hypothetical protein
MGRQCSTCEREHKCIQNLVLIPKHGWEDKSEMNLLWADFIGDRIGTSFGLIWKS